MGTVDLHIHTTSSFDGTATVAATLAYVSTRTNLDLIAITDHDAIDGALEALELAPRCGLSVIPGIEITTAEGHLLALWVTQMIPARLSLCDTLALVGEQGGLAIAPHPGGRWSGCLSAESIRRALAAPALAQVLVGGEEYNASLPWLPTNRLGRHIVHANRLAPVANSDAHMLWMIGLGRTSFAGHSQADLRHALVIGETYPVVAGRPWYYGASYLHRQALRGLGYAQSAAPQREAAIHLRRISSLRSAVSA